jgi:hypothetical protein
LEASIKGLESNNAAAAPSNWEAIQE